MDGFPYDKLAGESCRFLNLKNRCKIYKNLKTLGHKGCKAYDCFGGGPYVTKKIIQEKSWKVVECTKKIFRIFLVVVDLNEFLWYLLDTLKYSYKDTLRSRVESMIEKIQMLKKQSVDHLLSVDLSKLRSEVGSLLDEASKNIRLLLIDSDTVLIPEDPFYFTGKDMRKENLRGQCLKGRCLIKSNLQGCDLSYLDVLGVDFRDSNIKNANLKNTLFLDQRQVNSAIGDKFTILPKNITMPDHWV